MNGLNQQPCSSYGLADRFFCTKCGKPPEIIKADGRDPILVTFSCHGETKSGSFSRAELVFTQNVFDPAGDE